MSYQKDPGVDRLIEKRHHRSNHGQNMETKGAVFGLKNIIKHSQF